MRIVALQSKNINHQVNISDTEGENTTSNNPEEILSSLVAPYTETIKVVWSMENFLKPICKLLPKDVRDKLNDGDKAHFGDFKLFYGIGKGAVLGVDWDYKENTHANFYNVSHYESNIYELKVFYPNEPEPVSLEELRVKGQAVLDTLDKMGQHPTKLSSPASILEETILQDMNLYTMWDMPDKSLELAEWSANYCREWRTTYKLGHWGKDTPLYDFDLSAAYASVLSKIPDFHYARYIETNGEIPKGAFWGILKGEWDIKKEVSPIVAKDGKCYKGQWKDFATTTDLACVKRHDIGSFSASKGWFVKFDKLVYPFESLMKQLYLMRSTDNPLQDRIVKNQLASAWGRFIQTNMRNNEVKYGKYYLPMVASMTTSKIRAMMCDFIYNHKLTDSLISCTVDGILSTKDAGIPTREKRFGEWRLNGSGEALVLGQCFEWLLDKKPLTKTLPQMIDAINKHPQSHAYFGLGLRFVEHDRNFPKIPLTGNDLLNNVYESEALTADDSVDVTTGD